MNNKEESSISVNQLILPFTYRNIFDHFILFCILYIRKIPKVFVIFTSLWAVIEIITVGDESKSQQELLLPYFILIIVISIYITARDYYKDIPNELLNESKKAKKAFINRRIGWEYCIINEILEKRISSLNSTYERIKYGMEYIQPYNLKTDEYIQYFQMQPIKVLRLVKAVKDTCVFRLPELIAKENEVETNGFQNIQREIEYLAELFNQTILFEKEILGIVPNDDFEKIHSLMIGWTDPIRNGIIQYCENIKILSNTTRKQIKHKEIVHSQIVFDPPNNMNEFHKELEKLVNKE